MDPSALYWTLGAAGSGALVSALGFTLVHQLKRGGFKRLATDIIQKAEQDAAQQIQETELLIKKKELQFQQEAEQSRQKERERLKREEERLQKREDVIDRRWATMTEKWTEVEKRETLLHQQQEKLSTQEEELSKQEQELQKKLEFVGGLTKKEARDQLIESIHSSIREETARWTQHTRQEAKEHAEKEARQLICSAINRLAVSCSSKTTVCTLPLPSEEMKGRIIGREGRNIRALEKATGVNIVIDDSPSTVVISGFDPIRKHIAKEALKELVTDGRIHPTRIEEAVENAQEDISKRISEYGQEACLKSSVHGLHPELIQLIGSMHFRETYSQNLLEHSLEVSHLLGIMAAELGLNQNLARRIGLLHDVGKTVSHEIEGSHALIGYELAKKYGESEEVANGIGCHHNEINPITVEGSLCGAADALSASRPGARGEAAVEAYVKRKQRLEKIPLEFPGVEEAYVLQAGRELRVVVLPDVIDDRGTIHLARSIAKRIEGSMRYPGKIKVTLIREKRAVEYAL